MIRKWQNPGQKLWYEKHSGKCADCGKKLKTPYAQRCRSCSKLGTRNPRWSTTTQNISTHYYRARAAHNERKSACVRCNDAKSEIHHRDGDPTNNAPENIKFLCHACHMAEHAKARRANLHLIPDA